MDKITSTFDKIPSSVKVGAISAILAQPFEVIRTCSIINHYNINTLNFRGMLEICKKIFELEGTKGFFRGLGVSFLKISLGYTFFFFSLEQFILNIRQNPSLTRIPSVILDFNVAALSKTLTVFLVNPLNVIKTRFEVLENNEYKSIREAMCKIYKKEGVSGFYRGILASLIRDVPYSGIQYTMYQKILDLKTEWKQNKSWIMFAAGFSSGAAIMLTYPFDNIRVRAQFNQGKSKGIINLSKEVIENEGFSGLYKGYLPRLIKKICSAAISWSLYESYKTKELEKF